MKLILFKTTEQQPAVNSLKIAQQFFPGELEIYTDYPFTLAAEEVPNKTKPTATELTTEELHEYIKTLDEPIFIASSSTVFSAECFNSVIGAYDHFSTRFPSVVIQPTFDNDMLAYIAPTLLLYGDRHIYSSSNRITNNPPVLYGDSKILSELLTRMGSVEENAKPLFSDGIFHGGETVVLSPLPPFAWNLDKELPVLVSSAEFDAKTYINNIPCFDKPTGEINE